MTANSPRRLEGVVSSFDDHVGLGQVTADDGRTWLFHCIAIADGSRSIEIGARVDFELMPKMGQFEARDLRPS
ncbi:MAG: hypothetical protein RI958_1664 [Actinomycetota bacterium]|jgi:cold shock CspA family protein